MQRVGRTAVHPEGGGGVKGNEGVREVLASRDGGAQRNATKSVRRSLIRDADERAQETCGGIGGSGPELSANNRLNFESSASSVCPQPGNRAGSNVTPAK